ncbi:MAG: aminopeptidase [Anaerolineaceae bacterium]
MDKRWKQLGEILVNHSAEIKPGQKVMIAMQEVETLPLVQAVYEEAVKAGALVQVQFLSEYLRHSLMKYGTPEQIGWVPEIEAYGMEWADVYFGLRGGHNLYEFTDVPPERLSLSQKANGKISTMRWEKTRWSLVRVPNASFAQQAETDLETMMEMFFKSSLLDWTAISKEWARLADILGQGGEMHVLGKGTDLKFSVAGRKWLVGDGRINMPDGEIYTAPVHETMDGTISFEFPGVLGGRQVPDIQLTWKKGKLVEATASKNQDFLRQILASDSGSSNAGEFAFGVNPYVDRFTTDILIDEKIGGTIHLAVGRAYAECGGTSKSAIHWDIVKDTRTDSCITLDGKTIFENGKILI